MSLRVATLMAPRASSTRLSTSSLTAMPFFRTSMKPGFAIRLFEISVRKPSLRVLSWSKNESDMHSPSRRAGEPSPPARVPDYDAISREGGVPEGLRPPLSGSRFGSRDRPEARGDQDPAAFRLLRHRTRPERDPRGPENREKGPPSPLGLGRREALLGARRQHDDDLGRRESVLSGQGEQSARDRSQDHRRRDGRSRQGARPASDRRALSPEMGGGAEVRRSHAPSRVRPRPRARLAASRGPVLPAPPRGFRQGWRREDDGRGDAREARGGRRTGGAPRLDGRPRRRRETLREARRRLPRGGAGPPSPRPHGGLRLPARRLRGVRVAGQDARRPASRGSGVPVLHAGDAGAPRPPPPGKDPRDLQAEKVDRPREEGRPRRPGCSGHRPRARAGRAATHPPRHGSGGTRRDARGMA